jgi:hypothetical protein
MVGKVTIVAVFHLCVVFGAMGQVTVTGQLDVNAMQAAGRASFSATPSDIGSVADVFDRQTSTLYRSANINPATITVTFTTAQAFREFRIMPAAAWGDPAYRWTVETADSQSDLDGKTGSYHVAVPSTGILSDAWSSAILPSTITARIVRLTAQRLTGDNYVHIREWSIIAESVVTAISVSPADATILSGQSKQFAATGTSASAGTIDLTAAVAWSSLNTAVATVDSAALASAVAPGTATIRATLSPLQADATLHVSGDPTDLDVTCIERTPRYDYDAAKNNPAPGDAVVFTARVRNWGTVALPAVAYQWELDGTQVASSTITSFAAASERTVTLPWTWQAGNHTVGFRIDPTNVIVEASESNNAVTDRVNAIIAGFWVEQSLYNYFHTRQRDLNIGSNSWEDWIQRQMARQNALYAAAVYPSSPSGALDRVRIDKIVIVPDGALPLHGGLATNDPDTRDKTVDLMWGFPSSELNGSFYANTTSTDPNNPFYLEPSLIHELGHARYLIDCYGFDVHNTYNPNTGTGYNSVQILENGQPVAGTSLMPFLAFNEVLYYNKSGGVMTGPYGFAWSPYETAALNLIAGHRALCGNYNAPCNIGAYLQDLPQNNAVRFVDPQGRPLRGADVRVYQAGSGPDWYGKTIDNTPDLFFTTDVQGYARMPRNPFSSGQIIHTYGNANGVAVLRIQHTSGLWYRFLEVSDFHMRYWAGNTINACYSITLPGAVGSPVADLDGDGDVDRYDVDMFKICMTGPDLGPPISGCDGADLDADDDVDQSDFGILQRCLSGQSVPVALGCEN